MAQCLYQFWDREKHALSICGEKADWKKGKVTLCEAHARYAMACGINGIKLNKEKKKKKEGVA